MDFVTNLLQQGGIFMVPLLIASVLAVAIVLERFYYYVRLQPGNDAFRRQLREYLYNGKIAEAQQWLRGLRGPVPATALAALDAWDQDESAVEAAMASRARHEAPLLRRYMPFLDTTYSAAPLVGLLGTITGMMGTFRVVAMHLARDPNADTAGITVGIGEALITTATGILIAVTSLIFHQIFTTWAESHFDAAEVVAADIIEAHEEMRPTTRPKQAAAV